MANRRIPSRTLSPIGAFLSIAVMVFVPRQVWGCSCIFATDKTMYCEADFVLRARVVDRTVLYRPDGPDSEPYPDMYRHRIDNTKTLRSRINTSITDAIRYVETATDGPRCGMQLDNGKTYVFGGDATYDFVNDTMEVHSCGLVVVYDVLTEGEKFKYDIAYPRECHASTVTVSLLLMLAATSLHFSLR